MIERISSVPRTKSWQRGLARLLTTGLLAAAIPATAQPSAAEGPVVTVLVPEAVEGLSCARAVAAEGTAVSGGVHYSVQDLDLMQPVAVGLFAVEAARPVKLEIVKGEWTQVFRNCDTGGSGQCDVRFRTQGSFGIRVLPAADSPSGYQVAVCVGEEVQAVPSAVTASTQRR